MGTVWLIIVGMLVAGFLMYQLFDDAHAARELLNNLPHARICDAKPGLIRIAGQVRPRGQTLTAPWSGRPAVFVEVAVTQYVAQFGVVPKYQRRIQAVEFDIDDGTGHALVRIASPDSRRDVYSRVLTGALPPTRQAKELGDAPAAIRFLDDPDIDRFREEVPVSVVERIVGPADQIIVGGHAVLEVDPTVPAGGFRAPATRLVFETTEDHPLILARVGFDLWKA
jgi:hypothetical protein